MVNNKTVPIEFSNNEYQAVKQYKPSFTRQTQGYPIQPILVFSIDYNAWIINLVKWKPY